MRKTWYSLSLILALVAPAARAQIGVEVRLEQEQFLPTEAIEVSVRITNRTGQTLTLGENNEWLTFSVEGADGRLVQKFGEAPVSGKFLLESSKVAVKRVNIAPYFALETTGRYHVYATLHLKEWDMVVPSTPKPFDIIEGTKLLTQDVGVPSERSNGQPEVRRYMLQQANYLRNQLRLYLRVTDSVGGRTFRVVPIGKLLSFSRPDAQVDSASNLHVLYQSGPQTFSYTAYNTDGDLLLRQTYEFGESRPRLQVGRDSKISVQGGSRRVQNSDYPAPPPEAKDAAGETGASGTADSPSPSVPKD